MRSVLHHISLANVYHSLLALCPENWSCDIVDLNLESALAEPEFGQSKLPTLSSHLPNFTPTMSDAHLGSQQVYPVLNHLAMPIGYVILSSLNASTVQPEAERVQHIVNMLMRELNLNIELDDMAAELSARHEELNLVYSTSEQVLGTGTDIEILEDIVQNVVDYLDADIAVLAVKEKQLWILRVAEGLDVSPFEEEFSALQDMICQWLVVNDQPLVINDPLKFAHVPIAQKLPYRLLTTPIRNADNQVIGGLAMCKSLSAAALANSDKNLVGAMADKAEKVIQQSYDETTGFARQPKFVAEMTEAIRGLQTGEHHALLHISVQDTDYVTVQAEAGVIGRVVAYIAEKVVALGRTKDLTGRLDSGDLALLLLNCPIEVAMRKARELTEEIMTDPIVMGRKQVHLKVCVGISALEPKHREDPMLGLVQASLANRVAMDSVETDVYVYRAQDRSIVQQRSESELLVQVNRAIADDLFALYAQEIAPLNSTECDPHFEVLLRLFDEKGAMVSPADFIPLAEKHHLMSSIDIWVVRQSLIALLESNLLQTSPQTIMSINLSGQSLTGDHFLEKVVTAVQELGVPAKNICFEVTETSAISDLGKARQFIEKLRALGCKFALDDFGAGLSSFTYLRTLPLDYVKIDGFFVKDLLVDPVAEAMVRSIHDVGAVMGLETVGEYVENMEIAERLKHIGVNFGQGFGIGKPMPINEYFALNMQSSQALRG